MDQKYASEIAQFAIGCTPQHNGMHVGPVTLLDRSPQEHGHRLTPSIATVGTSSTHTRIPIEVAFTNSLKHHSIGKLLPAERKSQNATYLTLLLLGWRTFIIEFNSGKRRIQRRRGHLVNINFRKQLKHTIPPSPITISSVGRVSVAKT